MCDVMQMTGMGTDNCTGEEEYAKCVTDKCDYFSCYNSDACADQKDCFESSDDPCNADCMQSDDCTQCYLDKQPCVYDCLPLVTCDGMQLMPPPGAGMTEEGGGCDQLDDCCDSITDPNLGPVCKMTAKSTRALGDMYCEMLIASLCPSTK